MHREFEHFERSATLAGDADLAARRTLEDRDEAFGPRWIADLPQPAIGEFDLADPQARERRVVARQTQQLDGQLSAGRVDRGTERSRLRRTSGEAGEGQAGIADPDRDALQRQAKAV